MSAAAAAALEPGAAAAASKYVVASPYRCTSGRASVAAQRWVSASSAATVGSGREDSTL